MNHGCWRSFEEVELKSGKAAVYIPLRLANRLYNKFRITMLRITVRSHSTDRCVRTQLVHFLMYHLIPACPSATSAVTAILGAACGCNETTTLQFSQLRNNDLAGSSDKMASVWACLNHKSSLGRGRLRAIQRMGRRSSSRTRVLISPLLTAMHSNRNES
jgi:hypothetical protein